MIHAPTLVRWDLLEERERLEKESWPLHDKIKEISEKIDEVNHMLHLTEPPVSLKGKCINIPSDRRNQITCLSLLVLIIICLSISLGIYYNALPSKIN